MTRCRFNIVQFRFWSGNHTEGCLPQRRQPLSIRRILDLLQHLRTSIEPSQVKTAESCMETSALLDHADRLLLAIPQNVQDDLHVEPLCSRWPAGRVGDMGPFGPAMVAVV
jgi:hypothetical protein